MQPFIRHQGTAVPLQRANVDTDMIIRIERLMLVPRRDLGAYAFEMLRRLPGGEENPDSILNQEPFRAASILVCGRNFGCGSSREAAVWALDGMGIRCVIAPSFGDIFRENCIKNGILPVILDEHLCEDLTAELLSGAHGREISVDLEALRLSAPSGAVFPFVLGAFEREQLLSGTDEITSTLARHAEIAAHFARWEASEPWATLPNRLQASDGASRNDPEFTTDEGHST